MLGWYLDPALAVARAVGDGLTRFVDMHGKPPRVVLMGNHSPVAHSSRHPAKWHR
jgi:hypothetical protein